MNAALHPLLANAYRHAMPEQSVVRAVLADLLEAQANDPDTETLAAASFNSDDLYVYDDATLRFVRSIGCKSAEYRYPVLKAGESCAYGMRAARLGLWRYRVGV